MPTFNPTSTSGTTGTIQTWVVPYSGPYQIEAWGACGTYGEQSAAPGNGAYIKANFTLTAGETIKILVGQVGINNVSSGNRAGAGGGASWVVRNTGNVALLVAAGGNGGSWGSHTTAPVGGLWTPNNYADAAPSPNAPGRGGGGGNFSYNGSTADGGSPTGNGGLAFINGGTGGTGPMSSGGFGGGGGSQYEGGGGGGWRGGLGPPTNQYTTAGQSAYSYANPTLASSITGTDNIRGTAGLVIITALNIPPVATITSPANAATVDGRLAIPVTWTYSDSDSNPQAQYEVDWRPTGGTWTAATAGSGTATTFNLPANTFANDGSYEIRVRSYDGNVWSNYSTVTITNATWTTLTWTSGTAHSGTINTTGFDQAAYEFQVRAEDSGAAVGAWSSTAEYTLGPPTNIYVKVGGTWKQSIHSVKVGGAWKQVPPTDVKSGGSF